MKTMNKKMALLAAGTLAAALSATETQAAKHIMIDVNISDAVISGGDSAFSSTYTGDLVLSGGTLSGIQVGEPKESNLLPVATSGDVDFIAATVLTFVSGVVTGGEFTLEDDLGETYTADISTGGALSESGGKFSVTGITFDGNFSSKTFAGVDVTSWHLAGDVDGSFSETVLDFNSAMTEASANTDIFAVVPSPTAALAAIPMLGLLGLRSRRRKD